MNVPKFLKQDGDSLVYNMDDGSELIYYIPEAFFDATSKTPIAMIQGEYVSTLGICNWAIVDKNGKVGEIRALNLPTMMLCRPYKIDSIKDEAIAGADPDDYRILRFAKGDQVLSHTRIPMLLDNAELMFKLIAMTAKVPTTIPYNELWKLIPESAKLNGTKYGVNMQMFGMLIAGICRNPKNIAEPFRYTSMSDMHKYKPLSVKLIPKYISPYTAITSENWDEGIRASIMLSDKPDSEIPFSPLEKVMTQ